MRNRRSNNQFTRASFENEKVLRVRGVSSQSRVALVNRAQVALEARATRADELQDGADADRSWAASAADHSAYGMLLRLSISLAHNI